MIKRLTVLFVLMNAVQAAPKIYEYDDEQGKHFSQVPPSPRPYSEEEKKVIINGTMSDIPVITPEDLKKAGDKAAHDQQGQETPH